MKRGWQQHEMSALTYLKGWKALKATGDVQFTPNVNKELSSSCKRKQSLLLKLTVKRKNITLILFFSLHAFKNFEEPKMLLKNYLNEFKEEKLDSWR